MHETSRYTMPSLLYSLEHSNANENVLLLASVAFLAASKSLSRTVRFEWLKRFKIPMRAKAVHDSFIERNGFGTRNSVT